MTDFDILLVVPTYLTKSLKDNLEKHGQLDKSTKIRLVNTEEDLHDIELGHEDEKKSCTGKVIVPTTIRWTLDGSDPLFASAKKFALIKLDFMDTIEAANITLALHPVSPGPTTSAAAPKSLLAQVTIDWLSSTSLCTSLNSPRQLSSLLSASGWSYTIYPPMLLLPNSQPWPTLLAIAQPAQLETLYARLCSTFKVTHIALNGPIPLHSSPELMEIPSPASTTQSPSISERLRKDLGDPNPPEESTSTSTSTNSTPDDDMPPESTKKQPNHDLKPSNPPPITPTTTTTNILRSPSALTPLHGSFGPLLPPTHPPTRQDLASAFWCSAQQNGIHQIWAPRYTMFSRGNITEKARIPNLPVTINKTATTSKNSNNDKKGGSHADADADADAEAEAEAEPAWSAIDLYAGIGYFAFSYVRRGASKVVCWEINPWSVEGLRRGTRANHWPEATVIEESDHTDNGATKGKLVVYAEDNRFAAKRIDSLRPLIPPIRHVNCGFLPTSSPSWRTAVRVLDPVEGGWIHVHENMAVTDIARRAEEIVALIGSYVASTARSSSSPQQQQQQQQQQWTVECLHVERVKSFAPGVMHCVLDISISRPPRI